MVTLHIVLQCGDIKGMNSTTLHFQVVEKFPRVNQGVEGLDPLEFADLHVFDNAEDEFLRFAFRGFISGEFADALLVGGLLPCSHQCLFFVPDRRIIYGRFWGAGERGGVIRRVFNRALNKSNEVMDAVFPCRKELRGGFGQVPPGVPGDVSLWVD